MFYSLYISNVKKCKKSECGINMVDNGRMTGEVSIFDNFNNSWSILHCQFIWKMLNTFKRVALPQPCLQYRLEIYFTTLEIFVSHMSWCLDGFFNQNKFNNSSILFKFYKVWSFKPEMWIRIRDPRTFRSVGPYPDPQSERESGSRSIKWRKKTRV